MTAAHRELAEIVAVTRVSPGELLGDPMLLEHLRDVLSEMEEG